MKRNVINHLNVELIKKISKMSKYNLNTLTCFAIIVDGMLFNPITVQAFTGNEPGNFQNENITYIDYTKSLLPKIITTRNETKGIEDYENYVNSLSNYYNIDNNVLRPFIEKNMDFLVQQPNIESSIRIMLEHQIEKGVLKQKETITKEAIRLTTYRYTPEGSDNYLSGLGHVLPYLNEGSIYFNEYGYAVLKGGTKSKITGQVFGEEGQEYFIIAAATENLIGQYHYTKNDQIHYYNYGDVLNLEMTVNGNNIEHKSIVCDSCGASMDWSTTSCGKFAPKTEEEKRYCEATNYTKIDLFTASEDSTEIISPVDTAYKVTKIKKKNNENEYPILTKDAKDYIEAKWETLENSRYKIKTKF